MTLKKLLKSGVLSDHEDISIWYRNRKVAEIWKSKYEVSIEQMASIINGGESTDYLKFRVKRISWSVFEYPNCRIELKPPKEKPIRSTKNKAYKKYMKKYVKEHLDEIGLKDGGYAGDSADDDGCWNCKYEEKRGYEEPCVKCSHSYFDKWESKE